jgi:hypothetical protein
MSMIREEVTYPDGTVEIREYPQPPPPPPPVPDQIQMWQFRAMLIRMNMMDEVVAAVAASGNAEIQNAFEYAPNAVRKSVFLLSMASVMNISNATLDEIFIEGAKIR